MRMLRTIVLIGFVVSLVSCQQTGSNETVKLTSMKDSLSYSYGVSMAVSLKGIKDLDPDIIAGAIKEVLTDKAQMDINECGALITKSMVGSQLDFLVENGKKDDVITTASGLQYKVIEEGSGDMPKKTSEVVVHYTGKLIDGSTFDSSVDRGEPITFPLNRVIPGWTEGVMLMKEGGKIKLFVPYQLAYGEQGRPPVIPPYATLIFDVELITIK